MASTARDREESTSVSTAATVVDGPREPKRRWFGTVGAMLRLRASTQRSTESDANELFAFPSESAGTTRRGTASSAGGPRAAQVAPIPKPAFKSIKAIAVSGVLIAAVVVGSAFFWLRGLPLTALRAEAPRTGRVTLETQPAGSEVVVDGEPRGTTPLTLALAPGAHTIAIRHGHDERVVPLTIAAGAEITQYFEMKAQPIEQLGRPSVITEPSGAKVAIDGHARGVSPLVVSDLGAGEHTVTVAGDGASAERRIVVTPAATASVMFSLASRAAGPLGGWVSVSSPFDIEVLENNDVVGSSRTSRIMLAAGRHDLVLANRGVGYQEARRVEVAAGKTTTIRVDAPQASVSVNARPWAEVLVDGASIGQTPIANVLVTIGAHDVVFRNPQLGERKQTFIVTANGPNRIATDLTK
jgi:PEGA domain-containing protein